MVFGMSRDFLRSERKRDALIVAGLALLFLELLLLRAPLHESLWLDETLSVWVGRAPFGEVVARAFAYQGQSALYFLLLGELARLSTSELVLRLPSLVALLASAVILFRILRRWFVPEVCVLGAALFLSIDHVLVAGLSARPYAFALLTALGATLVLLRWVEHGGYCGRIAVWTALMVATFYFHYLFSAIAGVHLAFVSFRWARLAREQRVGFWVAVLVGLGCAVPGFAQLASISHRTELWDFLGTPSWRQLAHTLVPLGSIIFVGIGLAFTRVLGPYTWKRGWWRGSSANVVPLLIWWLGAPVFFFVHGHISEHSLYLDRWFLWVAPASCIVVCLLVAGITERRPRLFVICVAIGFMILREADRTWQVEDWRGASSVAREEGTRGPVLLYSGLVELETPGWIDDETKAPYLGAPFTVYPIGRAPVLLSSDPEAEVMVPYREGKVLPVISGAERLLVVAARKSIESAGKKIYVIDRWSAWLEQRGFKPDGERVSLRSKEIAIQRFVRVSSPDS